jgi:hypothetical protein
MYGWLKGVTAELRGEPPAKAVPPKEGSPIGETDWFVDEAFKAADAAPDEHSVTNWLEDQRANLENAGDESDETIPSPLPDWITTGADDAATVDDVPSAAPVAQGDVPDWLNDVADEDFEPLQFDQASAYEWLEESDEIEDEAPVAGDDEDVVDEAADWLAELSDEFEELTSAPLDPEAAGVEPLADEETAVSDQTISDTTDWLNDLTSTDDSDSDDDWLAALSGDEPASDMDSMLESEPALDAAGEMPIDDKLFATGNDWLADLNAVPDETIADTGDLADSSDSGFGKSFRS